MFQDVLAEASEVINEILGVPCLYQHVTGDITNNVNIVIDRNKPVRDDFNMLVGYRVEANILKSQIQTVKNDDEFTDDKSNTWRITEIIKENSAKWYVNIIQIGL